MFSSFFSQTKSMTQQCEQFRADHFTPHHCCVSADGRTAVALDFDHLVIAFLVESGQVHYFHKSKIRQSEILTYEKTNEQRPLFNVWRRYTLGSLFGGHTLGWAAAQSTPVTRSTSLNALVLKIDMYDLTTPVYKVVLLEGSVTPQQEAEALALAEHWHGMIQTLIHT